MEGLLGRETSSISQRKSVRFGKKPEPHKPRRTLSKTASWMLAHSRLNVLNISQYCDKTLVKVTVKLAFLKLRWITSMTMLVTFMLQNVRKSFNYARVVLFWKIMLFCSKYAKNYPWTVGQSLAVQYFYSADRQVLGGKLLCWFEDRQTWFR